VLHKDEGCTATGADGGGGGRRTHARIRLFDLSAIADRQQRKVNKRMCVCVSRTWTDGHTHLEVT